MSSTISSEKPKRLFLHALTEELLSPTTVSDSLKAEIQKEIFHRSLEMISQLEKVVTKSYQDPEKITPANKTSSSKNPFEAIQRELKLRQRNDSSAKAND